MIMGYSDVTYAHAAEAYFYASAAHLMEAQYDIVILLYEPSMLVSGSAFKFLEDMPQ